MGYGDQTWCSRFHPHQCVNDKCPYAFTTEHLESAIKWWGSGDFPISRADRRTDDCGYKHYKDAI